MAIWYKRELALPKLECTVAVTTYEPRHVISNIVMCATSKASDQPAHTRSLIRAFSSRLNILWVLGYWLIIIWATTCDFQQYGILTNVDSDEHVQPPFKLRNFKLYSVSSLFMRLAKALLRLRTCAGWSDALLVAHTTFLEISCRGSFGIFKLKRRLYRLICLYTCQNATLLEVTCRGSYIFLASKYSCYRVLGAPALIWMHTNNRGTDQPVHQSSLISAFDILPLEIRQLKWPHAKCHDSSDSS